MAGIRLEWAQSEPSVISDDFQIMLRGDIDRVV